VACARRRANDGSSLTSDFGSWWGDFRHPEPSNNAFTHHVHNFNIGHLLEFNTSGRLRNLRGLLHKTWKSLIDRAAPAPGAQ
jgi:hypothetical protein